MAATPEGSNDASALDRDHEIVAHLPDGVAVLDPDGGIHWANEQFAAWCCQSPLGCNFFAALDLPDVEMGSFRTALAAGRPATATLRTAGNRFFDVRASAAFPVAAEAGHPTRTVVAVRDVTDAILEQQKRAAIHAAGQKLADLSPRELADMTVDERIELLKSNILHYSKDLLKFDCQVIRLLDRQTGRLE